MSGGTARNASVQAGPCPTRAVHGLQHVQGAIDAVQCTVPSAASPGDGCSGAWLSQLVCTPQAHGSGMRQTTSQQSQAGKAVN
jgi:hypothetical protein